jgi:anti-sigma factor RsiW
MNEREGIRLMEYLDGRLTPAERAEFEALLARDPQARAAAAEHRRLWSLLGEALPAPQVSPSEDFRRATVARADADLAAGPRPLLLRPLSLAAAALLLGVSFWAYKTAHDRSLAPGDRDVVAHLGMLEHYDFLQSHGEELDVAIQADVMRHLSGEMPREKGGSGR